MREPLIIIPARYGSSRFPGKPLVPIAGKPLIEHTWRAAKRTGLPVLVATDSSRIFRACERFGADVIETGSCNNGTERCAEAALDVGHTGPVINWQGDSPLTDPRWIPLMLAMLEEQRAQVVTPIMRPRGEDSDRIRFEGRMGRPGATTAVVDTAFRALYFSKAVIPSRGPLWLHIGLYAYTAEALACYGGEEGDLERTEQLEQLRFVERGCRVLCVPVEPAPLWEVNNPDDVAIVERLMGDRNGAVRA